MKNGFIVQEEGETILTAKGQKDIEPIVDNDQDQD